MSFCAVNGSKFCKPLPALASSGCGCLARRREMLSETPPLAPSFFSMPSDQLKYVFDFGDWIEHTLTLVAIHPAEQGVEYPREVYKPR